MRTIAAWTIRSLRGEQRSFPFFPDVVVRHGAPVVSAWLVEPVGLAQHGAPAVSAWLVEPVGLAQHGALGVSAWLVEPVGLAQHGALAVSAWLVELVGLARHGSVSASVLSVWSSRSVSAALSQCCEALQAWRIDGCPHSRACSRLSFAGAHEMILVHELAYEAVEFARDE